MDTLRYDSGIPDGFYTVGEYKNDKLGINFLLPYAPCRVMGVQVFANHSGGFKHSSLCREINGLPFTTQPLTEIDTIYSASQKWKFTPIEINLSDPISLWFILDMEGYPGIGGDTSVPSGNSWYYSDTYSWRQTIKYNWFIRLLIEDYNGYYEDFIANAGSYIGDWKLINPLFIPFPRDNCWATQIDTIYPNNARLTLLSPWIKIKDYNLSNPTLFIRHFYNTEMECDGGNIKVSLDSLNWQLVTPFRGYDTTILMDPPSGPNREPVFSGNSVSWKNEYFSLPKWDSLKIRFYFISDGIGNNYPGWFIDEIGITEKPIDDVSPVSINFQTIILAESIIIPEVSIKNFGIYEENGFEVECKVDSSGTVIYQSELTISSISPDSVIKICFPGMQTGRKGTNYKMQAYTKLGLDGNKLNDTLTEYLTAFSIDTLISSGITIDKPIIDGIIDTVEWEGATIVDASDIMGIDTKDSINTCNLYFMHNQTNLFIGVKTLQPKELKIYMDDCGDKKWGTNDGWYSICPEKNLFYDYYYSPYTIPDSLVSIGNYGIELCIPKGNKAYEITLTGEYLGCFIYVKNYTNNYSAWWPQSVPFNNYNNPTYYARIKVSGLGIENSKKDIKCGFSIFPNPFIFVKSINCKIFCPPNTPGILKFYDICGKMVKKSSFTAMLSPIVISQDISNLNSGIYFIVLEVPNYPRFIKKLEIIH